MKGLEVTEAARSISLTSSKSFSDNMTYRSIEQSHSLFKPVLVLSPLLISLIRMCWLYVNTSHYPSSLLYKMKFFRNFTTSNNVNICLLYIFFFFFGSLDLYQLTLPHWCRPPLHTMSRKTVSRD